MKIQKTTLSVVVCAFVLSACSPIGGSNQTAGSIIGAGAGSEIGGLLTSRLGVGGQIAGVIGGAIIGGLIGGQIGAYLDEEDRRQLQAMMQATGSTGSTRSYVSRKSGVRINTRVVKRAAPTQTAQECRSVEAAIVLADGSTKTETVNSCRGPNGWVVS
jgi:surface antigen